jgi:hypothetical protein
VVGNLLELGCVNGELLLQLLNLLQQVLGDICHRSCDSVVSSEPGNVDSTSNNHDDRYASWSWHRQRVAISKDSKNCGSYEEDVQIEVDLAAEDVWKEGVRFEAALAVLGRKS